MSFDVDPGAYGRFMGRFSEPLAVQFAGMLDLRPGDTALDVGCGPGALTAVLVERLGETSIAAIDPSEPFVRSLRARFAGVDCRVGYAEDLPFDSDRFDLTAAQLVVHFMANPIGGLREMMRVTKTGGTIAATVWNHADGTGTGAGTGPLSVFWTASKSLRPDARDESGLAGVHEGELARLFVDAGARDVTASKVAVRVEFASFDDWWQPFTLGVGPAGEHVATLDAVEVAALRARCAELLPPGPFAIDATAWVAIGRIAENRS